MLPSLIRLVPKDEQAQLDPEDIFASALSLLFPDDPQVCHGDPENLIEYHSRCFQKRLLLTTADPAGEDERRRFAHYVWNSSLLMAEFVGGRPSELEWRSQGQEQETLQEEQSDEWWLNQDEQRLWSVQGQKVLELGAGLAK